jgi:hypothetical protein
MKQRKQIPAGFGLNHLSRLWWMGPGKATITEEPGCAEVGALVDVRMGDQGGIPRAAILEQALRHEDILNPRLASGCISYL